MVFFAYSSATTDVGGLKIPYIVEEISLKALKKFAVVTVLLLSLLATFSPVQAAGHEMQMILESQSRYDFAETVARFEENVEAAGWKVVGVYDYKEILAEQGYDVLDIKIYALCSGRHSAAILSLDDERMVSPLMPCTMSIYEKSDGNVYIARLNSGQVAQPFGGTIAETMGLVAEETEAIIADLIQ